MSPILAIAAAAGAGWVAVLDASGECVLARRDWPSLRDATARLPLLAAEALAEAHTAPGTLGLIAAVAGPGSYTGLRASLAFAHGLALAAGVPLVPVTVEEADGEGPDGEEVGAPAAVARTALRRRAGLLPALAPLPIYAGEAHARAAPTRPAPARG